MKTLYNLILCLLLISGFGLAQQANGYFPSQTGFTWNYHVTPLDSANNSIDPLAFYRADSFAINSNFRGMSANIVLTKSGTLDSLPSQPYNDSLFYHFDGTDGLEYFSISRIKEFLLQLDELGIDPNFNFVDFFTSLQDWYPVYQFNSNINTEYLLKQVDTSFTYSIFTIPIQFKYLGTRLQDETIQTALGSFECKKFLTQWKVSADIFQEYSLLTTNDTIWIAPDNWIVQDIIPGQYVNLDSLPFPLIAPFSIPGLETKLTNEIVSVENEKLVLNTFIIKQNYPNPFNPTTTINYQIPELSFVTLIVYDILGNEVAELVNEEKSAGAYSVNFKAKNLSSGIYFYSLQATTTGRQAGNFVETKKMVLMK